MISPQRAPVTEETSLRLSLRPKASLTLTGKVIGRLVRVNCVSRRFVGGRAGKFRRAGRLMGSFAPRCADVLANITRRGVVHTTRVFKGTPGTIIVFTQNIRRRRGNISGISTCAGVTLIAKGVNHPGTNMTAFANRNGKRNKERRKRGSSLLPNCQGVAGPGRIRRMYDI